MKIGFDLDKVLINYPPLIPGKLIDWLYKHDPQEILSLESPNKELSYHIPKSRLEIFLRKLSHLQFLRSPIQQNVTFLKNLNQSSHQIYLISSRYKFLEEITYKLLKKYDLFSPFKKIYLNLENQQPHIYKEKIIKELGLNIYIDDDLDLLQHVQKTCPQTAFYWYNPANEKVVNLGNIHSITSLEEIKPLIQ